MDIKAGLYVDEVYSYSQSNSPYGLLFPPNIFNKIQNYDIWKKWVTGQIFKDYITVSPGNEFNYSNVCDNQKMYSHPPLYYYVLHSICSCFTGEFSKWFGLSLNLIAFIIVQFLLFHDSKLITNSNKYSLFICLFFGFSLAAIDNFTFIGPNSLTTIFNLLLLYYYIKILNDKNNYKLFIAIGLILVFGLMTHYLFFLYATLMLLTFTILECSLKNYKVLYYCYFSNLCGFLIAYLIFPSMGNQLLTSLFMKEVTFDIGQFIPGIGWLAYYIRKCFCIPVPYFFYLAILTLIAFITTISWLIINKYYEKSNKNKILLLIIPLIVLYALISFFANYNYLDNSYYKKIFFSFYPILSIALIAIIKRTRIPFILSLLLIFSTISPIFCNYLIITDKGEQKSFLKNSNIIFYTNSMEYIQEAVPLLASCKNVYLFPYATNKTNNIEIPPLTDGQTFLLIPSNETFTDLKYTKLFTTAISTKKVDVYDVTNIK